MKKLFSVLCTLLVCTISVYARDVKISVTPSDAKIYVDGNYVGNGIVISNISRKDEFIVVKCEKPGYVTLESKIYFRDKRKGVSYVLRNDSFLDVSAASGLVNKYFTVTVSNDLYTEDEFGERDTELAWKMIHQVILNYFDEIATTDKASGFVQTPWHYQSFPESEKQLRTRISVKESNLGGDLTFQIKVSSEVAPIFAMQSDQSFQEINRISKDFETIISEFQTRLGDN